MWPGEQSVTNWTGHKLDGKLTRQRLDWGQGDCGVRGRIPGLRPLVPAPGTTSQSLGVLTEATL